jgi:hypothetical protein
MKYVKLEVSLFERLFSLAGSGSYLKTAALLNEVTKNIEVIDDEGRPIAEESESEENSEE